MSTDKPEIIHIPEKCEILSNIEKMFFFFLLQIDTFKKNNNERNTAWEIWRKLNLNDVLFAVQLQKQVWNSYSYLNNELQFLSIES